MTSRQMACGEFGPAQWWLGWADWFEPGDYRHRLIEAALHRNRGEMGLWRPDLEEARRAGAPPLLIEVEERLARYQWIALDEGEEELTGTLVSTGALPGDVATAFFRGCIAQGESDRAEAFLNRLPSILPDQVHRDYLRGAYRRSQGDLDEAETLLARALAARPGHEPARRELAAMLFDRGTLDRALEEYVQLAIHSPGCEAATIGMARVLRRQGRLREARALLTPLVSQSQTPEWGLSELAWVELESGDCAEAERRLRQLPLNDSAFPDVYSLAVITVGLRGRSLEAQRLAERYEALRQQDSSIVDLRSRLANDPNDRMASEELRAIEREVNPNSPETAFGLADLGSEGGFRKPLADAEELYARHCRACHGDLGDGRGPAARHLFPRPRNLWAGSPQIVSTLNAVPTPEDIGLVLTQGMPGTSMPSFKTLTDNERGLLVEKVLRYRREGIRELMLRQSRQEGEETDEAEIERIVETRTTPGESIRVPNTWPDVSKSAARGKKIFLSLGCNKCHGIDGRGGAAGFLFDEQGQPTRPRDYIYEPFQGGHDPASVFRRINAGIPGTPMPSSGNVPEAEVSDLVQYIRSLARTPQHLLSNFERRVRAESGR